MFPLSVCVNLDRKRGNVLFPGAGALAEGTPGRGRGRGARKEQEGVWGGDVAVTLAMLLSARLHPPLAFNNSTGARDPARDSGARSQ